MPMDLAHPDRAIRVGVLLTAGTTELLDVAPVDLFHGLTPHLLADLPVPDEIKNMGIDFDFYWVSEIGGPIKLTAGATVATQAFKDCPSLDIALMGASNVSYQHSEGELAMIRTTYDSCAAFLTICGGFQSAHEAGLFKGKTVTAPRPLLAILRQKSPDVDWQERRWARDGKLWTSGALLNGLDMMQAFARDTWPEKSPLVEMLLQIGSWPARDLYYKDVAEGSKF